MKVRAKQKITKRENDRLNMLWAAVVAQCLEKGDGWFMRAAQHFGNEASAEENEMLVAFERADAAVAYAEKIMKKGVE